MKRLLLICLVFLGVVLTVKANGEPDFASKYLMLYGQTYDIDCKTISPQMMERILSGVAGSEDENTMRVLSQIKSIRILTTEPNACQAKTLFEKAEELAAQNKRRYSVYSQAHGQNIYVRRRGKQFLELVVVKQKEDHTFYMLSLTGYLSDKFLQQVLKM